MPCTKHKDQQEQQNRLMPYIPTFSRTLSGLRFSEQQSLQSFSISPSQDQLVARAASLSADVQPDDSSDHIGIRSNELGGNISEVLDNLANDDENRLTYSNPDYIDNGVIIRRNSLYSIDNQSPTSSSSSSHLDNYTAQTSNLSQYLSNERLFARNHESSHKQDPSTSPSTTRSDSIHNQAKPSPPTTIKAIKTTSSSHKRLSRTSKKDDKCSQSQNNQQELETWFRQPSNEEKVPQMPVDESEKEERIDTYEVIAPYYNRRQAGVITNYLFDGSRFKGFQKSRKESYEVEVQIQHVDYEYSYLCGYLCINHLTKSHPSLTTFFDGEIISKKYPFLTKRWQATREIDQAHWSKFKGFDKAFNLDSVDYDALANSDYIYMRWKEHFLVPDHKIKYVEGASYEGFYYICYSKRTASIKGFYFHSNSENFESFQSLDLELDHQGSSQVYEFR